MCAVYSSFPLTVLNVGQSSADVLGWRVCLGLQALLILQNPSMAINVECRYFGWQHSEACQSCHMNHSRFQPKTQVMQPINDRPAVYQKETHGELIQKVPTQTVGYTVRPPDDGDKTKTRLQERNHTPQTQPHHPLDATQAHTSRKQCGVWHQLSLLFEWDMSRRPHDQTRLMGCDDVAQRR